MAWTEQMIEDLKRMWDEGLSTGEIGKRLGVTKNSIIGKVHRLQLTARPSPIKKKEDTTSPAPKAKETKETKAEKPSSTNTTKAPKDTKPASTKDEKKPAAKVPAEEIEAQEIPLKEEFKEISPKLDRIETMRNSVHVEHPKGKHKTMLTDSDNHTCRWPIGDPKDENFHFCGRKVKIGQTYCEEHAAIAYVKANSKK